MSTPELFELALRAPIPTLAERARRARHILARMGVVVALFSCSNQLNPKAQRAADKVQCVVDVVAPLVGDVFDAGELVREWIKGRANLGQTLQLLGATPQEIQAAAAAVAACHDQSQAPKPDAGTRVIVPASVRGRVL